MTERQGGSDVRANETAARAAGDVSELDGHKWFCSAPMSDAFLVLAQAPGGLSCFLLERPQRGFRIERLKDKLGNRSNASAEIALEGAVARLVGEEGRGSGRSSRWSTTPGSTASSARLRDAARGRGGDPPRRPPLGLRPPALRSAADAERPRGSRVESEAATYGDAARARLRRGGRSVPAHRHRRRQVLDLQADAAARRRGARVPGRQRLRRGVAAAAALPREPAQLDLARVRQRQRTRRPAGARPRAGDAEAFLAEVPAGDGRRRTARRGDRTARAELAAPDEQGARRLVERWR